MPSRTAVGVKTVLVADDTAFVRDRFRGAIEGAGHRAVVVATGPELLAAMRRDAGQIDLVVTDLRLPQGHGLELLRAIRRIDNRCPVLVFSGTIATSLEVRRLAELGVAGYVNEYTAVQHIVPALAPHLFPDHYNRRSGPRAALSIPVAYRCGNTIAAALTMNISAGGLAIRTTSPLDAGTAVRVRFRLPGAKRDVDAEASVAWSDRRLGMGLQFTGMPPDDQQAIDTFVQEHFFSNRKA